jgi:hypothetical protein
MAQRNRAWDALEIQGDEGADIGVDLSSFALKVQCWESRADEEHGGVLGVIGM